MNNYSAWKIKESAFPKSDTQEQIKYLLGYAVLAPSTFNSQPWKCSINKNVVDVYLDISRMPKKSDVTGRFGHISIGCFIENIVVASQHFGLSTNIQYTFKNKGGNKMICRITFAKDKKSKDTMLLFPSIVKRVTNRNISQAKNISDTVIKVIQDFSEKNVDIVVLEKKQREKLLRISYDADIAVWSHYAFRKEHVTWVRNNATKMFDGMPGFGVGVGLLPSFFAKPMILSPLFPKLQAKKNVIAITSSPHCITLLAEDNPLGWIYTGRIYERIALFLTEKGIAVSPLGQFIENNTARKQLAGIAVKNRKHSPQLFFRIGFPTKNTQHSPRFTAHHILLHE